MTITAPKQIKLAIFDVDGTLLDTSEGILSSVDYALKAFGLSIPDNFSRRRFIGPPIQDTFRLLYPELDDERLAELALCFRNHYKDFDLLKATPYPEIFEVCEKLVARGVRVAVATYKRMDYAQRIMEEFGFTKFTNVIHGQDFAGKNKKSDIIANCIADVGCSFDETVMIGDTLSDANGALAIGCPFLAVTYGFGFSTDEEIQSSHSFGVAKKPLEILSILGISDR